MRYTLMEFAHQTFVLRTLLATNRSPTNTVEKPIRKKLAACCCVTIGNSKMLVAVNGSVTSMASSYRTLALVDVFMSRTCASPGGVFYWRWKACIFRWLLCRCNEQGLRRSVGTSPHPAILYVWVVVESALMRRPPSLLSCHTPRRTGAG